MNPKEAKGGSVSDRFESNVGGGGSWLKLGVLDSRLVKLEVGRVGEFLVRNGPKKMFPNLKINQLCQVKLK